MPRRRNLSFQKNICNIYHITSNQENEQWSKTQLHIHKISKHLKSGNTLWGLECGAGRPTPHGGGLARSFHGCDHTEQQPATPQKVRAGHTPEEWQARCTRGHRQQSSLHHFTSILMKKWHEPGEILREKCLKEKKYQCKVFLKFREKRWSS